MTQTQETIPILVMTQTQEMIQTLEIALIQVIILPGSLHLRITEVSHQTGMLLPLEISKVLLLIALDLIQQ